MFDQSSLFLTRFDRNKSVAMSIERDERFSSRFSRLEISFIRRPVECKLDSVKVVQLLYAYMHSNSYMQGIWNVPRNVRDDWNREGKARVHVSLEFGYTLLFPGNKIITLLRTTIDLNHCVSKQNVTYTTLFLHVKTIFKLYLITFSNNINFLVSICKRNTSEYKWKFLEPRCVIHRSRIFR